MSIDQPTLLLTDYDTVEIPLGDFPKHLQLQLQAALIPVSHLWESMHIDAFRDDQGVFLCANLKLGERPLRLMVNQAGTLLRYMAPVVTELSEKARAAVEELNGDYPELKFLVAQVLLTEVNRLPRQVDTLFATNVTSFSEFCDTAGKFLPYLIRTLGEIEGELESLLLIRASRVNLMA